MLATKDEIIRAAKALPEDEQLQLLEELEAAFCPVLPEPRSPEEFRAELDRRWEEYKSGKVRGLTLEEVQAMARQGSEGRG